MSRPVSGEDAVLQARDGLVTAANMPDWDEGTLLYGEVCSVRRPGDHGNCQAPLDAVCGHECNGVRFDQLPPLGSDERPYDRGREES